MDQKKFTRIWSRSGSVKEVCKKTGITDQSAYYWARKFRLASFNSVDNETTPTQEEIAERAAEVRSRWSPEEEERRCVGSSRSRYEVPSYPSSNTFSCGRV
jgi:transposase-like protein